MCKTPMAMKLLRLLEDLKIGERILMTLNLLRIFIASLLVAISQPQKQWGLWYEPIWAHWLVIGTVSISIPPEIYEIWKQVSLLKAIVFVLNILILLYLLRDFPKKPTKVKSFTE
jgi:uncharacterized membrane protein (DUF2068 family)